jgi:dTDP-4-amino-4,6-dideoxygalactose transaminase
MTTNSVSHPLIRLSKSSVGEAEKQAVRGVLDRAYLGMGAEVQQFEQALTGFFGRPVACVVNGTAALHLALQSCGVGAGDEVLVPSLTYLASFQAISATGARPIACEIDARTLTLDWRDAESRLTPHTRAIMPVHYTGGVGDLAGTYAMAKRNSLRVVEDAAHAFGTTVCGNRVGSFGDIACFSFDGIKNITSGEGGCIVTDDPAVLERVRDGRLLGVKKDTDRRYTGERSWEFDVTAQGWRYHMSNIMAAIGIEQLKRFAEFAAVRTARARQYDELLAGKARVTLVLRDFDTVVPHIYVIRIADLTDRKALQARMLSKGVQTGSHYQPNHTLSLYKDATAAALPVTESVYGELLTLPLHADMTAEDVDRVCDALLDSLRHD